MRADGRYSHRVFAGVRHQHPGLARDWWDTLWGKKATAKGDDAAFAKNAHCELRGHRRGSTTGSVGGRGMDLSLKALAPRIRSHWQGNQTLGQAFGISLVLVALPATFCFALGMTMVKFFPGVSARTPLQVLFMGGFLSVLLGAWWCRGMFAMSMVLATANRLMASVAVFVVACAAGWWVATDWAMGLTDMVYKDWTAQTSPPEAWEKSPAVVLPLPELHRFELSGSVGWGSAQALQTALAAHPTIHLLELESDGGFVHEGNLLVDLVRKHHLDTLVRGKCYSTCANVFLAGERRFIGPDASLGFHQSGYAGRTRDTQWSTSEYESSIFYRERGMSPEFMEKALNTSYFSMWVPSAQESLSGGIATHWWSERPREYR
jgi:ATP-dependent protease ClpP protease subunit